MVKWWSRLSRRAEGSLDGDHHQPGASLGITGAANTVETSIGPVTLSARESSILRRLLADSASMDEGQAFYRALSGRGVAFPIEWELHILRATVAALPERDDLLARLAIVEETLSPSDGATDITARLAFEKAWARFFRDERHAGKEDHARRRSSLLDDACTLLSSAVFEHQPLARQISIIVALHHTLLSAPSPELLIIADLGLRRFTEMLRHPDLNEADACSVYDALHSLYFSGTSDVRHLGRFDAIVGPFETWLEQRHGRHPRPDISFPADKPLTVAYMLHVAHLDRGNAVSPLIGSLAIMHAARADRRVLLYAVQHMSAEFLEWMNKNNVEVRSFDQGYRYNQIDQVAASLKSDAIDVVVTEQNRAIASALFVRRVAPRQVWIDTGFPFWSLKSLDWWISPVASDAVNFQKRISRLRFRQTAETLKQNVDLDAVARLRATFPPGALVLGVFVRLVKLDQAYLDFLARLLLADPRFHLVLAGPGDTRSVEAFVERADLEGRITFVPGSVDLNLYGPAIDLMCDTFPFIGGNACREVSAHGTPVLSKLGTPWDETLKSDRSPDLLAASESQYIALAVRIASDEAFRASQRQMALDIAAKYSDPTQVIDDVEMAITASVAPEPHD
ncbi:hypothetical protein [Tardiphaga sp. 11_C7_N12_6]|uniref:hypothetical protein n=1 Tax=Tardiphaga sp. 11_C7_N12_6 TaxID=3240789 RepID=UPI003F1FD928